MIIDSSADTQPFWDACSAGKLLVRFCVDCERSFYPPRMACPNCGLTNVEWRQSAGTGTVYTYSRAEMSFGDAAWAGEVPYVSALVDLDDGIRMLSRLVGPTDGELIGKRVEVAFTQFDQRTLPYFRLSPGA